MHRLFASLTLSTALVFSGASATLALRLTDDPAGASDPCSIDAGVPSVQAKAILACLSPSIAFVKTPVGSGSGVLIDGGYVVTNAHVVDPFAAVDLVFEGGERHEAVPVEGVDLMADIAVIGPVKTARRPMAFANPTRLELEKGDDLYLVGYPGEVDDLPDATISRGILSRTRRSTEHGLSFLQTDAAISGGQSGGVLADGVGHVVGVSGYSFAEEFGLALSGPDVERSIQRVMAGDVPAYRFLATEGATSGSISLVDSESLQLLTVPASDQAQTVRLTLPAASQPAVSVTDMAGEMLFANQAALDAAAAFFGPLDDAVKADAPVAPGVFEFSVPKDTVAAILVGTRRAGGAEMAFSSNVALGRYDDQDQNRPIRPGQRLQGNLDGLEVQGDSFVLDLQKGDAIEIYASSAVGDVAYAVRGPGQAAQDATFVDDSGIGLFDSDAKDTFVAETSGTHHIYVVSSDGMAAGYTLRVSEA